jgi:hypothetical protein
MINKLNVLNAGLFGLFKHSQKLEIRVLKSPAFLALSYYGHAK